MLKDIESIDKRIPKIEKSLKGKLSPAELKSFHDEFQLLKDLRILLEKGDVIAVRKRAHNENLSANPLLSTKKFLIIANVAERELENNAYQNNTHYQTLINHFGKDVVVPVSARAEYELTQMDSADAQEFMEMLGVAEPSLNIIIRKTYENLNLITFFTCGPREIHAWPIRKNTAIRQAAGEIHSDLERGFICAEVFNYNDLVTLKTEAAIKIAGKMRIEGQHYVVQDGDIIHVRFNV
jgi:hypothetical protein